MPGTELYGLEKLSQAVEVLATHQADVKGRLQAAFPSLVAALAADLPEDIRAELEWCRDRLTRKEPLVPEVGRLAATLRGMHLATGKKIAERIVAAEWKLRKKLRDQGVSSS